MWQERTNAGIPAIAKVAATAIVEGGAREAVAADFLDEPRMLTFTVRQDSSRL